MDKPKVNEKYCEKCKLILPASEFKRVFIRISRDGLSPYCRECRKRNDEEIILKAGEKIINLTNLVSEYKNTKDNKILADIFKKLKPTIKKKASYCYYHKWYPLFTEKCEACRDCKKVIGKNKDEKKKICDKCKNCKCKGAFNLSENNLCKLDDVKSDLCVEIMRIINKYDVAKDFNKYLFGNLWVYKPALVNEDLRNQIKHEESLYKINIETDEEEPRDDFLENSDYTEEEKKDGKFFADYLKNKDEKLYLLLEMIGYKKSLKFIAKSFDITIGRVRSMIKKLNSEKKKYFKITIIVIGAIIPALFLNAIITKFTKVNFSQNVILLKNEVKKENKEIKLKKKSIKIIEEPKNLQENNGQKIK